MDVQEATRTVYFWLTNEDQRNEGLQRKLKVLYRDYRAKGYMPVVFWSGREDLTELTWDLLLHNRMKLEQISAKKEMEACARME